MGLIAMPSRVFWDSVSSFKLQRGGTVMRSRYTGRRQTVTFPFAMWTFEGTTLQMEGTDAGQWRRFLSQLNGMASTFDLVVPGTDGGPLSGFTGTAAVGTAGAAVGATSMPITTAGGAGTFLKEGDYFTINGELKVVGADCPTGTDQTLTFQPFLRQAAVAGMALTFINPYAVMAAADFDQADHSLAVPAQMQVKLKAAEALEVDGTGSLLLLEDDTSGSSSLLLE